MKFEKGKPRPKNAGRKKGTPNKKTERLRDLLSENGCDLEAELAKAIINKDIDLIKALSTILPYLQPKLKEADNSPTQAQPEEDAPSLSEVSTADLIKLVKGEEK